MQVVVMQYYLLVKNDNDDWGIQISQYNLNYGLEINGYGDDMIMFKQNNSTLSKI